MSRTLAAALLLLCAPAAAAAQPYNPGDNAASSQTPAAAFERPGETASPGADGGVRFGGSHAFRSFECRGGDAVISGDDNRLKLKDCSRLTVSGARNLIDVSLASPGDILVSGARNAVTYRAPADGAPRIADSGEANSIKPTAP